MDEVERLKARYFQTIEDGRKIEVFTSMPEWKWYVESVINPTVDDYVNRIMTGKILSDKEDWILRGMVMGIRLITETPENFKSQAEEARKKVKSLQDAIEEES